MILEEILYDHLKDDTALNALVSGRIYPDFAPQNVALPFVTYTVIDRVEHMVKPNVSSLRLVKVRIQFDVYASTYLGTKSAQAALTNALYGLDSGVDSSIVVTRVLDARDMSDTNEREHRVSMDASVTFNE